MEENNDLATERVLRHVIDIGDILDSWRHDEQPLGGGFLLLLSPPPPSSLDEYIKYKSLA